MKKRIFTLLAITAFFSSTIFSASPFPVKSKHAFAKVMTEQYHMSSSDIQRQLQRIQFQPDIIDKINHPAEKKNWDWYQNFFLKKDRINAGLNYWHAHRRILNVARKKYGINPSIIVAIAGIETYYGKRQGQYNMLNALGTLAFHYPARARFFQKELANYFLLNQKMPLAKIKSSYAGAIGIPQFMPSSYLHYGVSATPHQTPNLMTSDDDAILSIANYLHKNGWKRNQYIILPAISKRTPQPQWFLTAPTHSLRWYQEKGIKLSVPINTNQKAALVKLDTQHEHRYWLALPNFYSLMSYNPRINYAMAVFRLSRALQHQASHAQRHA